MRPPLATWQLSNPAVYVVDQDVRELPGDLVDRNAAELQQWRMRDELSPTACAILAFLSLWRGLRANGRDGCGVQLSLAEWVRVLGRSPRMVQYAFEELRRRGFIFRRRRFVRLQEPWEDRSGKTHVEADIRYAVYLTEYGARRIERRGETRRLKVIAGRGLVRVLAVCGVVENLLTEFSQRIRTIARRVTDAANRCAPSDQAPPGEIEPRGSGRCAPVESASRTGFTAGGPAPPCADAPPGEPSTTTPTPAGVGGVGPVWRGGASHAGAAAGWLEQLEDLWRRRALTPATAWPDAWAQADAKGRAWLTEQFAQYRRPLAERLTMEMQCR